MDTSLARDQHVITQSLPPSTNPFDDLDDDETEEEFINNRGGSQEREGEKDEQTDDYRESIDTSLNPFPVSSDIDALNQHWHDLSDLMESPITNPFALQEFQEHLTAIADIMEAERLRPQASSSTGECLELLLSDNVLEKVYLFTTRQRNYSTDVRVTLLTFFKRLLSTTGGGGGPPLFIHQQVLRPLNRLLRVCETSRDSALISSLIPLLHQICVLIQENESFLDLFFTDGAGHVPSKFFVFSQLVPFLHDGTEGGVRARDAMLLCLSVAGRSPHSSLSDFIIADTDFCQVLATGLSGLYSSLPTLVELPDDDWISPLSQLQATVPELKGFLQTFSYCNSVLQMAPLLVCQAVTSMIKNGFLQQVLGPAMLQSSPDEATVAIGYMCLFLLNITNVQLMKVFLQFILLGSSHDTPVLHCLIQYISSSNSKLAAISLELFYILINLNCEDVMLHLILQYLLPGHHIMTNQLATVANRDHYCVATRKLLELIPQCCSKAEELYLDSLIKISPHPSRTSSPPCQSSPLRQESPVPPTTPASGGSIRRTTSLSSTCSNSTNSSISGVPLLATSPSQAVPTEQSLEVTVFEYITPQQSYYNYLMESHSAIEECAKACQCWSSSYSECVLNEERSSVPAVSSDHLKQSHDTMDPGLTISVPSLNSSETNHLLSVGERTLKVSHDSHVTHSPSVSPHASPRAQRRNMLDPLSSSSDRFSDQAGLFLKILLEKLSSLLVNSPIVNELIIKLISRLAQYSQPLLRSLLLNHHLVLKPGIPNLLYVLQDLKQAIDKLARERETFEQRLGRARKTLIFKAAIANGLVDETAAANIEAELRSRSDSYLSDSTNPPNTPVKDDSKREDSSQQHTRRRAMTEGVRNLSEIRRKKKRHKVTINTVYAIVMFGEFLKELASLSQEHSILNPELLLVTEDH